MSETHVNKMNELLRSMRDEGVSGVRLFVPDSRDVTVEDVAHDFCRMEEARANGACDVSTSVEF